MEQLEKDLAKVARTGPKAANAIKKTGRAAATASGNVQRLGIAFRTTLAPIVAITGSLALLNKALNVTGQRSAEASVLSSSLKGLVDDGDAAADALLGIADRLGKATLFDEEDFTAQFKLFTSFRNIGVDSYERVGEAAADIATKLGTGPKEAALQLAKALEDPAKQVTALARSGTVFTEQQKEQIKTLQESGKLLEAQDIILKEIETQYGGAAKAAGSAGFAGALDSAGEAYRDFLEALGSSSESGAVDFLNAITEGLNFLARNFDVVAQAASAVVDVFVQPFVALGQGIAEVLPKVDNFEQFFRGTLAIVAKILTDITTNVLTPVFKFVGKVIGGIVKLLVGLGSAVGSVIPKIVSTVTGAIRILGQAISMFINSLPIGILGKLFGIDAGALATAPLQSLANNIDGLAASVSNYGDELKAAAAAANLPQPGDVVGGNPFAGAGPRGASAGAASGSGGSGAAGAGSADKLAKEAAKRAAEMAKGLKAAQGMLRAAQDEELVLKAINDLEKIRAQGSVDLSQISIKYAEAAERAKSAAEVDVLVQAQALEVSNKQLKVQEQIDDLRDSAIGSIEDEIELLQAKLSGTEDELIMRREIAALTKNGTVPEAEAAGLVQTRNMLKEQVNTVNELDSLYESIGNTIETGIVDTFTSGIKAMIDGSKELGETLQEIASGVLLDIGKQLLSFGVKSALGGLGGGGGFLDKLFPMAEGGPVKAGNPYLVGEEGPELIVPRSAGTVITAAETDAAMSRWSSGNAKSNAAMARGEDAGGGGSFVPSVNVTTGPVMQFQGEDYVSRADFQAGLVKAAQDGAKAGEARTLRRLQMSPGARRKAGI